MSECPNAMLSVALPQAQLAAAGITPTRAARWKDYAPLGDRRIAPIW